MRANRCHGMADVICYCQALLLFIPELDGWTGSFSWTGTGSSTFTVLKGTSFSVLTGITFSVLTGITFSVSKDTTFSFWDGTTASVLTGTIFSASISSSVDSGFSENWNHFIFVFLLSLKKKVLLQKILTKDFNGILGKSSEKTILE